MPSLKAETAAGGNTRKYIYLSIYSSPRRLSADCPPTGQASGPAQGTSSRGEGLHPTWATSGGPGYAALCDTCLHPCTGCPPTARLRAKPLDRRWGAKKPRPLTSPPPPAGLDPHPASPQTASLLQARRAIHGYEDTASRRSGEYSVAPQLPATLRSLLPGTSAYHHAGPVDGMCTTLEDAPNHVSSSWEVTNRAKLMPQRDHSLSRSFSHVMS